jgi:membrane protein
VLIVSLVSGVMDVEQTKDTVEATLEKLLPKDPQATKLVTSIIDEVGAFFNYRSAAGWIAGIALLWLASALFSSLRTGLNAIFHIPTPKFFVLYKLKDMAFTIVIVLLILLVTLLSPLLTIADSLALDSSDGGITGMLSGLTVQAASLIATSILFLLLYKLVPNKRLPWQIVLMSTGFAVVFWELARKLFSWYVYSATNFSKIYGGSVAIASFAVWLYYSAFIFLLAAELGQYIYVLRTKQQAPEA